MTKPSDLLKAWFDATDRESLARAEDAILAASAGALTTAVSVDIPAAKIVRSPPSDLDPLAAERRWLTDARIYEGGPRCTTIFGALGETSRSERVAHIAIPFELKHPTIDAPMRLVPVPPPAMRPPVLADDVWGAPAIDAHLGWITRWAHVLGGVENLAELDAHTFDPINEAIAAVVKGAARWVQHDDPPLDAPGSPGPPDHDELRFTLNSIALDGDRLALDNGHITVLDLANESVSRFDARGAQLEALVGPHLLFAHPHALDTRDRTWTKWPDDVLRMSFAEGLERSFLFREDGASARLHEIADYPVTNVFTVDRRFLWGEDKEGSGGIFRTRDAAYVASFAQSFDERLETGTPYLDGIWGELRPYEGEEDESDEEVDPLESAHAAGSAVAAIAVRDDVVLTYRDGIVARDGEQWFALALRIDAVAFDRKGERLAVHVAPGDFGEAALLVFDLRGDEPVLAFRKTLSG